MKPNKPGIFDPWRQEAPEPPPVPRGAPQLSDPDEGEPPLHCVQYKGKTAGVNVWLEGADWDPEDAKIEGRDVLIKVVTELEQHEDLRARLHMRGVNTGGFFSPNGMSLRIVGTDGRCMCFESVTDPVFAIQKLALALREVQGLKGSPAPATLEKHRVKPFVF